MKAYLDLVKLVLENGKKKHNRTGIDTLSISGAMFQHDMSEGFPLLTSKKMGYKTIFAELEFFIKGLSNKIWLQKRGCHIWDEWCSPDKVPYGNDEETKKKMKEENDLGPIYGVQWRNFDFIIRDDVDTNHFPVTTGGSDQLKYIVDQIKNNPESRRILCSAWNPNQLDSMALPPCHVLWQVLINTDDNTMDLIWYQRSCDLMLGIPYNIASYAMLLELLCLESNKYKPGKLVGFFADLHIYENHIEQAKIQLGRPIHKLPTVKTEKFKSIFDWEYTDSIIENYEHENKLVMEVAV